MKSQTTAKPAKTPKAPVTRAPAPTPAGPANSDVAAALPVKAKAATQEVGPGVTLPANTRALMASRSLEVAKTGTYIGAKALPKQIAALLMDGVRKEAVSDETSLAGVLENYIDEGKVDVYSIRNPAGGAVDTWLRFTCGDTEVGYIFTGNTLKAIVGDQDINPF